MQYGIDLSNFAGDVNEESLEAVCCSENVSRVIISAYPTHFAEQARVSGELGLPIEAYQYIYNTQSPLAKVNEALEVIQGFPVERLWIDLEDSTTPWRFSVEDILIAIRRAKAETKTGIYTRKDFWLNHAGNPQIGRYAPLWLANWDNTPYGGFDANFGGWVRALCKQYKGEYQSYGVNMDLNSWE